MNMNIKVFIKKRAGNSFRNLSEICKRGNDKVACSALVMGLGQLLYKQWAKGFLYLLIQAAAIAFFVW
jgi:hypothetical protein